MHLPRRHNTEVRKLKTSNFKRCLDLPLREPSLMSDDVRMTADALVRDYIRLHGVSENVRHEKRSPGLQEGS